MIIVSFGTTIVFVVGVADFVIVETEICETKMLLVWLQMIDSGFSF